MINSARRAQIDGGMNELCHGEKRSDVAIQLEFQMDCRAPPSGSRNDRRGVHQRSARSAPWRFSWIAVSEVGLVSDQLSRRGEALKGGSETAPYVDLRFLSF
jgi:hypothetical protein